MFVKSLMGKRVASFLCSVMLVLVSVLGAFPSVYALDPNLIANPSAETNTVGKPDSWASNKWGTNTSAFTYKAGGHTGAYSLSTKTTAYSSGDAKWYPAAVAVSPNTSYTFSNWYTSTRVSSLDVEITSTTGAVSYKWLGNPAASAAWKQNNYTFITPANAAKVTMYQSISGVGEVVVDDYSLATTNGTSTPPAAPTAPTVSMTAPTAGATVVNTIALSATASDAQGVKHVQFKVDGINVGAADTTAPYSVNWDTKTAANGTHNITAAATNTANLTTTTAATSVNVANTTTPTQPTAPAVSITAPATGATVNNTTTITANASDASGIKSVQFRVDGINVGAADTTAPFSLSWDSKTVANGPHTMSAVATSTAGQSTTSADVAINVSNAIVTPPTPPAGNNLIKNPSFETSANGTSPDSWLASNWGTNTSNFSYLNSGHTGNRSAQVTTTAYSNGAANWFYDGVPVTAGKTYLFSNWYKSTVETEVDAEVTMNDGTVQYFWLGNASPSADWTQYKNTFTIPAGAKSVAIYQILAKNGTLTTDDYSLTEYAPVPYNRGLVTITFDDGWVNQFTNARTTLNGLGFKSTYYIISGELNTAGYMTNAQVKTLYTEGNEIGSHSISHPDFTTLTATQVTNQFSNSQTTLQTLIGAPVTNFAYPYGAYNANTIAAGKNYYASQRSVERGLNTRDNLDVTRLKIQEVNSETTNAQVQTWILDAVAQKAWLVLCYHEIANTPVAPDDAFYTVTPANFTTQMNYLKSSGAPVVTLKQALAEVQAQP